MNSTPSTTVIVGLGQTGLSVARYLVERGVDFRVVDSRIAPPGLDSFKALCPDVDVSLGDFASANLDTADRLILSPGVALQEPAIAAALAAGAEPRSDIDLFCGEVSAPIVAITGSNAKSTVTTLVGLMAQQAGLRVGVCGNVGVPVLDLLGQPGCDVYVMELSSFQLDITHKLRAEVACVLNVSPDHLDRYAGYEAYRQSKQRVFVGCRAIVDNLDEPQRPQVLDAAVAVNEFTLGVPQAGCFGLLETSEGSYLAYGEQRLLAVDELKIKGMHNTSNALASLAIGNALGLPLPAMVDALRLFKGLPHRCQWVAAHDGVEYFNDSKGTNVGATVAALNGLGETARGRIVLIAGGDAKGADFTDLVTPVADYVSAVVLIGRDAAQLERPLVGANPGLVTEYAASMPEAVLAAQRLATQGDIVLLSPACASLDMFTNYMERGQAFVAAVETLA